MSCIRLVFVSLLPSLGLGISWVHAEQFSASFELVSPAGLSYAQISSSSHAGIGCSNGVYAATQSTARCNENQLNVMGFDSYEIVVSVELRSGEHFMMMEGATLDGLSLSGVQSLSVILQ